MSSEGLIGLIWNPAVMKGVNLHGKSRMSDGENLADNWGIILCPSCGPRYGRVHFHVTLGWFYPETTDAQGLEAMLECHDD